MEDLKDYLSRKSVVDAKTSCWIWTGTKQRGYGKTRLVIDGKLINYRAHRLSYEVYKGPIPHGMFICHSCDTPSCINPDHLFVGTPQDNVLDMDRKARRGSERACDRLTAEQIALIRTSTLSAKECAARFGVTNFHIYNVRKGRRGKVGRRFPASASGSAA